MSYPSIDQMLSDPRTASGSLRETYFQIWKDLDYQKFKELKVAVVQKRLESRYNTARDNLQRLVELSYLEQGEPGHNGVNTFRLVWNPLEVSQTAPPRAS